MLKSSVDTSNGTPPPSSSSSRHHKKDSKKDKKRKSSKKDKKKRKSKDRDDWSSSKKRSRHDADDDQQEPTSATVVKRNDVDSDDDSGTTTTNNNTTQETHVETSASQTTTTTAAPGTLPKTSKKGPATVIKITVAKSDPLKDPLLVSFPNGLPLSLRPDLNKTNKNSHHSDDNSQSSSSSFSENDEMIHSPPTFQWYEEKDTNNNKRRKIIVRGSDDSCLYEGSINNNKSGVIDNYQNNNKRSWKLYVGVYDKTSHQLQIQPCAERGSLVPLRQSVKGYDDVLGRIVDDVDRTTTTPTTKGEFDGLTYAEKRSVVFNTFGSSKKKKLLRSVEASQVKVESVVGAGAAMMDAVGKQSMSESNKAVMTEARLDAARTTTTSQTIDKAYDEARRKFLPPFNRDAKKPHEIYDVKEMAGELAWMELSNDVDDRLANARNNDDDWIEAMTEHAEWNDTLISFLKGVSNPEASKNRIKTILLLRHCLQFCKVLKRQYTRGTSQSILHAMNVPHLVGKRLLELFAIPEMSSSHSSKSSAIKGYVVNKQMRDKLNVHVLILHLLIHGREMSVGEVNGFVENQLQLEIKDAMRLYREAGCKVNKNVKGMVSVSLTTPLTFPPPRKLKK